MKKSIAAFTVLCVLLLIAGCKTGSRRFPELKISTLRVGVTPDFPPLIFTKDGEYQGVEADFARKLGEEMEVRVKFVPVAWLDLIPALTEGKVDVIMSAMSITPDRKQRVVFTRPYFTISQMALIRTRDIAKFPNSKSIVNSRARIGVVSETTGDYFVREKCKKARRIPFSSIEKAKEELLKGRIDAVISDASSISNAKHTNLVGMYEPLNEENLAWAVSKKHPELLKVLNTLLEEWQKDGTLQRIKEKWLTNLIKTKVYQ